MITLDEIKEEIRKLSLLEKKQSTCKHTRLISSVDYVNRLNQPFVLVITCLDCNYTRTEVMGV